MSIIRVKYTDTALPQNTDVDVLFDSTVAWPMYAGIQMLGRKRLIVDIKHSHALDLKWYKPIASKSGSSKRPFVSADWNQIGQELAIAAPASTSSTIRDFLIAPYADFLLTTTSGGNQTTYIVDMVLTDEIPVAA